METKDPVEDFIPDESGGLEGSFFNEGLSTKPELISNNKIERFESSDEEDAGNPMVASYMEDIEPDNLIINRPLRPEKLSSSDEEPAVDSRRSPGKFLPHSTNQQGSSPENGRRKEKKRHKSKTKHRHDSTGTKKQIDLEMFLNGSPEDAPRSQDGVDYEPL